MTRCGCRFYFMADALWTGAVSDLICAVGDDSLEQWLDSTVSLNSRTGRKDNFSTSSSGGGNVATCCHFLERQFVGKLRPPLWMPSKLPLPYLKVKSGVMGYWAKGKTGIFLVLL